MKWGKLIIFCFSLFVFVMPVISHAQHITVPIHYSKWIKNYTESDGLRLITPFSEIPIAFFMENPNGEVFQYEKLEIGINLPEEADRLIQNFIRSGRGTNPFDPEQIRILAHFTHLKNDKGDPSTKKSDFTIITRDAFYYEEFHQELNDDVYKHGYWKKDTTSFNFRIRFAPEKSGWWSCSINILLNNELKFTLPTFDFLCHEGTSKGFIHAVSSNKRLLQFQNGENFYGIGQNIPVPDLSNAIKPAGMKGFREQPPQGYNVQRSYISELSEKGGNLIRIMNGVWTDAIEWEKLNNYSDNMCYAWEFDQTINHCQENEIYILWVQELHTSLMVHNPFGNHNLSWQQNPYHLELGLEKPELFFTDDKALKHYKNRIRYMLSRWGFSTTIMGIQPINEINEVASDPLSSEKHHPYFTDSAFRNDVAHWLREIKKYIHEDLNYPFLISSSYTADLRGFVEDDPCMKISDFIDYHPYCQNRNRHIENRFIGINNIPGYGLFKRYEKPIIQGEIGTWETEYLFECNENEFHNDLWGSAFNGGLSVGVPWHNWEDNFKMNLRDNYLGLSFFIKCHSDFITNEKWQPRRWPESGFYDTIYDPKKNNYFESVYLVGNKNFLKNSTAIGWIHNRSAYWYNYPETTCEKDLSNKKTHKKEGKKTFRPDDDDDTGLMIFKWPEDKNKCIVKIKGLQRLKKYEIFFYNTTSGNIEYSYTKFHFGGSFEIQIDPSALHEKYQDLAFCVIRKKDIVEKIKF